MHKYAIAGLLGLLLLPAAALAKVVVWTASAAKTITTATVAPADGATTLALVAPINGVASGQVIVSAADPLTAVRASCSDLRGPGASIAGAAVRVRYLTYRPLVPEALLVGTRPRPDAPKPFHAISDAFLPSGDALQPVYVTVAVPVDAAPGVYTGTVHVATNAGDADVPVRLSVADFVLPDRSDLDIWLSPSFSPTQLAYFYGVPHYAEAHWQAIEQQLTLAGALGNHILYLPVLWHTNNGSGPQMIAFREVDGALVPDFTRLDRYLGLVRTYLGPQRLVVLGVWGPWIREGGTSTRFPGDELYVTRVDAGGGYGMHKLSADYLANADLWKAVFAGVAARVQAQLGVPASKIILGNGDDRHPSEAVDAAWRQIAPESPGWHAWTHHYGAPGPRPALFEIVDAGSGRTAPGTGQSAVRGGWEALGGKPLFLCTARDQHRDGVAPGLYYALPDVAVGRQKCGVSVGLARIGLDYWPKRLPSETGGAFTIDTGFHGGLGTDPGRVARSRTTTLTAPGPQGPVPMVHYEALREGIQAAQARILVEKALAGKVGDAPAFEAALLAHRADGVRLDAFYGYDGNVERYEALGGWHDGALAIYEAAGQAQKLLHLRESAMKSALDGQARQRGAG